MVQPEWVERTSLRCSASPSDASEDEISGSPASLLAENHPDRSPDQQGRR